MKKLWLQNRYRVWIWCWVFGDMSVGIGAWEEYRRKLNSNEDKDLCELIVDYYSQDIDRALSRNLLLRIYFLAKYWFRDFSGKGEVPF